MNNKWQLYQERDYKNINDTLDNHFNELITIAKLKIKAGEDSIKTGRIARQKMEKFMDSIDGYGASDTEPRSVLITLICDELNLKVNKATIAGLQ